MAGLFERLGAHKELAVILTCASVVMFVGSLLMVPWLIARAPRDFFTRDQATGTQRSLPIKVLKNVAGLVLVLAGILMLLLPGQGVLTLIVGVALLDVPGKHALLVRGAKRPSVMQALNFVRKRTHREPFDPPA